MHFLEGLSLFGGRLVDELGDDGQFGEVEEGLVVAEVDSVAHNVHFMEQSGCVFL